MPGFRDGVERFRREERSLKQQREAQGFQEAQALLDLSRRDRELAEKIRELGREVVDVLTEHGVPSMPEVVQVEVRKKKSNTKTKEVIETGRRAWVVFHRVTEHTDEYYSALVGGVYSDGEYLQHGFYRPQKHFPKVVSANSGIRNTIHPSHLRNYELEWRCISSETFQRGVASLIESGRPIDVYPREAYPQYDGHDFGFWITRTDHEEIWDD